MSDSSPRSAAADDDGGGDDESSDSAVRRNSSTGWRFWSSSWRSRRSRASAEAEMVALMRSEGMTCARTRTRKSRNCSFPAGTTGSYRSETRRWSGPASRGCIQRGHERVSPASRDAASFWKTNGRSDSFFRCCDPPSLAGPPSLPSVLPGMRAKDPEDTTSERQCSRKPLRGTLPTFSNRNAVRVMEPCSSSCDNPSIVAESLGTGGPTWNESLELGGVFRSNSPLAPLRVLGARTSKAFRPRATPFRTHSTPTMRSTPSRSGVTRKLTLVGLAPDASAMLIAGVSNLGRASSFSSSSSSFAAAAAAGGPHSHASRRSVTSSGHGSGFDKATFTSTISWTKQTLNCSALRAFAPPPSSQLVAPPTTASSDGMSSSSSASHALASSPPSSKGSVPDAKARASSKLTETAPVSMRGRSRFSTKAPAAPAPAPAAPAPSASSATAISFTTCRNSLRKLVSSLAEGHSVASRRAHSATASLRFPRWRIWRASWKCRCSSTWPQPLSRYMSSTAWCVRVANTCF
mmetsp:Transcript_6507/g.21756  ORF Transcript_6507/g.21756 Transcript_6507/m.21756 type:complete len:520 (-) Transcript_6507:90-1649(-)